METINKMNIWRLGLFLLLLSNLSAENSQQVIQYEISYLRIPLVNMTLTWVEDDSSVRVSYENKLKSFINFIHPVHNIYRVQFRKNDYYPLSWSKSISEGNMQFQLGARRSTDGSSVLYSNGSKLKFPDDGLTVFSATHFLASKAHDPEFFPAKIPVFVDGELWMATATRFDEKHTHPEHDAGSDEVIIQTDLHYVSGTTLVEKNDMLTREIAKEGTRFLLWVEQDGTYSKAQFGKFPKAVVLTRLKN